MQHGDEVLDLVFPARDEPPRVVKPGKQAFDFPAAARAAQRAAILRAAALTPVRGDHLDPVGGHEGRIKRITVVAAVDDQARQEVDEEAGVKGGGTSCGSYGEALATCTAIGRPWRSQIAMILLPLPRPVGITAAPPFSPRRRWHRRRPRSDRVYRGRGGLRRGAGAAGPGAHSAAIAETADGRFDRADTGEANR